LVLAKAHWQQGIWASRVLEHNYHVGLARDELVNSGINHFALAIAYFDRYWPDTMILKTRLNALSHALSSARITQDKTKFLIDQLASQFQIDLTILFSAVGKRAEQL
jgi:hypothetical protein